jgi:hypothetical protein
MAVAHTTSEYWNGKIWSVTGRLGVSPGVPDYSGLAEVSCASPRLCVAIGSESDGGSSDDAALVDRWNGKVWTVQPDAVVPYPESQGIDGVSCSRGGCTLVGQIVLSDSSPRFGAFAERWSAGHWATQPTPNPPDQQPAAVGGESILDGVSCIGNTCIAVGSASVGPPAGQTLIEEFQ